MSDISSGPAAIENLKHSNPHMPVSEFMDMYDAFKNSSFSSHWHHELEIQLILKGEAAYTINGVNYDVREGSAIYIAPEAIHSSVALQPGTLGYNILVLPQLLTDLFHQIGCDDCAKPLHTAEPEVILLTPNKKENIRILKRLERVYEADSTGYAYELLLTENLLGIWRDLLSTIRKSRALQPVDNAKQLREQRLRKMIDYIHLHYTEDISVQDIAVSANISRSECFRCFSDLSKTTPSDYLNKYRLRQAAQMLVTSTTSISEICFQNGFNSASHFPKEFKRMYGESPKNYRAENATTGREEK